MVKTYKSAIDLWLAAILIGVPLAIIFTGVSIAFGLYFLHWHENIGRLAGFFLVGGGVALGALIAAFTLPCRYTLRESELHIQCGVLQAVVPYRAIRHLELSCSLWSAPALSLNRVKIVLADGFRLISPKDRIAFIKDLQSRIEHPPAQEI
jgi:membrane protein YdbS with pleckstrin-like domain